MDSNTMDLFKKLFAEMPDNIHNLVFYSPGSSKKVITNEFVNKILKKTLTDLKIESISIHGLRHTHASVLLYKKISIYYVSERLGHAKIDTTLNYYSHVIKELREEDTRSFPAGSYTNKKLKKTTKTLVSQGFFCFTDIINLHLSYVKNALGEIRTPDLQFRKLLHYPLCY